MTWSTVWISPQAQFGGGSAPIFCKKYCVRPTPVLTWLRLFLRLPLGFAQGSGMNSFKLVVDKFYWSDQRFAIQVGKVKWGFSSCSSAACVAKCLLGRRCPSQAEGEGTRHLSLSCVWASLVYCTSHLSSAGGMPDSIGRLLTGVAVSVPLVSLIASLRTTSTLLSGGGEGES